MIFLLLLSVVTNSHVVRKSDLQITFMGPFILAYIFKEGKEKYIFKDGKEK